MPRILIDGVEIHAEDGALVLEAAAGAGLRIPSICSVPGLEPSCSCMACLVRDRASGKLLASCAAAVSEGMDLESNSPEVVAARRRSIGFLLAEHAGDCEGPCQRACPAGLDVPRMLAAVASGDLAAAYETAAQAVAFPAISSRLCRAPCEKACRRSLHDSAVAVKAMEGFAASCEPAGFAAPACAPGRKVVIAGAGMAGLSAAYHLARAGVSCTVMDCAEPFACLRSCDDGAEVDEAVLEKELDRLRRMGVAIERLADFDLRLAKKAAAGAAALIVAIPAADRGERSPADAALPIVLVREVAESPSTAVRALAAGREAALEALSVMGVRKAGKPRFESRPGRLDDSEVAELMRGVDPGPRIQDPPGALMMQDVARAEALRCMRCDCLKKDTCRLRAAATDAGFEKADSRDVRRRRIERDATHPEVVYEPGKCILCGACIQISERCGEPVGIAFQGRGYGMRVSPPPGRTLAEALETCALECADACPTGALSRKPG